VARPSLGHEKVNFYCDPAVMRGLRWLAKARGTSYSELLRLAAKQYVVTEIAVEQHAITALATAENADA
jgi:hypothetical protein